MEHFHVALINRVLWSRGWEIQVESELNSHIVINLLWVSTTVRKALPFPVRISSSFSHLDAPRNHHLTQAVPSNILRSSGSPWMVPLRRIREWQLAMAAHSGLHGKALPEAKLWTSWKLIWKMINKWRSSRKSFYPFHPLNLTNMEF